jgi:hypothetical protein
MKIMCLRCGNEWETRTEKKPKTCPGCKSPYYEKPLSNYWRKVREKNLKFKVLASGQKCECSLRGKLVGDGCQICKPGKLLP